MSTLTSERSGGSNPDDSLDLHDDVVFKEDLSLNIFVAPVDPDVGAAVRRDIVWGKAHCVEDAPSRHSNLGTPLLDAELIELRKLPPLAPWSKEVKEVFEAVFLNLVAELPDVVSLLDPKFHSFLIDLQDQGFGTHGKDVLWLMVECAEFTPLVGV